MMSRTALFLYNGGKIDGAPDPVKYFTDLSGLSAYFFKCLLIHPFMLKSIMSGSVHRNRNTSNTRWNPSVFCTTRLHSKV